MLTHIGTLRTSPLEIEFLLTEYYTQQLYSDDPIYQVKAQSPFTCIQLPTLTEG